MTYARLCMPLCLAVFALSPSLARAQISIDGLPHAPVIVNPEPSTGLSALYVIETISNASVTYEAKNASRPVWYTFGQMGAAYADPIPESEIDYSGNVSILGNIRPDCGYVIEDGSSRTYFWVIDYSNHELKLNALSTNEESDCSTMFLQLDGHASPIYYYNINGRRLELSREMTLSYATMEYSADSQSYVETETKETIPNAEGAIHCAAALCDTEYTLEGDRFLRAWGMPEQQVSTPMIAARRVEAHTEAQQISDTSDNQQHVSTGDDNGALGGSAPVEITFSAQVTPAALYTEWQLSSYPEFDDITLRDNNLEFSRSFRDAGTVYVRFVAADANGGCEFYSEVYQVNIGESDLHCPNAFSPQGSPGINDEWKVSYRSITEFKCSIFNRWGICVATLDHPSQGWDGKYKGKYVGSGVYYYVIKAKGADGRQYNLKGDINIINYNNEAGQGTMTPAP
ncbi:gliding motility-associated C-terminal domain-containing protein [uncultured Muribaculum sp.]|nr:gliding motility-associated C-terminal domain-containing protein [uncultured Muribaculum sp.]